MIDFSLYPDVYDTGEFRGLRRMLEEVWVRRHRPGDGTFYIISGFANFNGGARFYPTFRHHVEHGGKIVAYLAGSASQRLSSKQVVEELLDCGVDVSIVNRKRLLHAKCYGVQATAGESLIVSSGNFTAPGMSQNVEGSVLLGPDYTHQMGFSWESVVSNINSQKWLTYKPTLQDRSDPVWKLLYDEYYGQVTVDESQEVTLLLTLGHHDTARIQANPGTAAALGTQYFWLSKDCFDFFPPLTLRNQRGLKQTFSAIISLKYIDLGIIDDDCRVTFEAENNLDFRLGTGQLRHTKLANSGDLASISRISEGSYELRIFQRGTPEYSKLLPYAVHFIGHRGKRYGFIDNNDFENDLGLRLGK